MKRILPFIFLFLLINTGTRAQKVGLVFSGGAAKGLAHIGVLKALEENNIPIDYIVGTSMGGIVGGMYAAGYSPSEIEYIALSRDFQDWVSGRYNSDYRYYFRKKPDNPSIISAKLQIDTGFHARIRSNLVNDIPLNFALLEMLAQPSANARNNFDNLFVPFRTVVSDVLSQKMIPVKSGSLVEAIRGTMTVPLVYRPIKVDGKYVFDGGLYNNFPVDVMKKDFDPDIIIGANVSSKVFNEYPKDNDEKLMSRFLIYMFLSKSDSTVVGDNGVYIQPDLSDYSVTNFTPVAELIKKGYDAAMADMPRIKELIKRRISTQELKEKRNAFEKRNPDLAFRNIYVEGGNSKQREYVERVFRQDKKEISLMDVKEGYYKLAADDNFETIYPNMKYQQSNDAYDFILQVQQQRNFKVDFGGVISTRPISNAYLGLQYNFVRRKSYTASANFYSGRFYESAQAMFRIDYPTRLPFYIEPEFTYNHWNYTNTSEIFVENVRPVFVEQSDRRMVLNMGIPLSRNGKLSVHGGFMNFDDKYSPTNSLQVGDQLDRTVFNGFMTGISLEKNTLNRKMYANKGISFSLTGSYYNGSEEYTPGNIFRNEPFYPSIVAEKHDRSWLRARLSTEQYIYSRKAYSLGYVLEVVASSKPLFATYKSNILSAPAFHPLQDSKTLYLEKLRANNYGAFGLKNIFGIYKNIDLRLEGYIFQPLREFHLSGNQDTGLGDIFAARHYAATAGLVYHSPVGPLSLSFNHYDDDQKRYGIMFHIGYLIYNKRSFE